MKRTQTLLCFLFGALPFFGFSQYSYDQIFGEYIFQVDSEPIYEKLIIKDNYRFGYERKASIPLTPEEKMERKQFKGLVGKYYLEEDKLILNPTKMWIKKQGEEVYSVTDPETIEKLAYMPKTMFIYEENGQLFMKINNDIWVKTK